MTDDEDAQAEYNADTDLQELLTRAWASPTVHRDDDGDDVGDGAAWVDRLRSGSRLRDVTDDDDDNAQAEVVGRALAEALWANNQGSADGDSVADVRAERDHDNVIEDANQARISEDIRTGDGDDVSDADSAPDGRRT